MSEVIKAYIKAQSEMGAALKRADNPFLKSKYADLNSVIDVVYPAFHQNGFAVMQFCGRDDHGDYVMTSLMHHSDDADPINSKVYLSYKKGDMQSYGGAITYARRYGMLTVCGVAVDDDDGNSSLGHQRMQIKQDINEKRLTRAQQELLDRGDKLEQLAKKATHEQMTKFGPEANTVIEKIKEFKPERAAEIEVAWNNREQELGIE